MKRKYHICHNDGCENRTREPKFGKHKGYWIHYKDCHTCANLKTNYGITTPERDALGDSVDWTCVICETALRRIPEGDKRRTKQDAVVDHCHHTGTVRGVICAQCNRGLGYFKDDYETIKKAMEYLK